MSAIFRTIIRSLGTENISNQATQFLTAIVEQKKTIPMEPGEVDIAAMLYEQEGKVYFIKAAFDAENKIKRFIDDPIEIKDLINNALKTL